MKLSLTLTLQNNMNILDFEEMLISAHYAEHTKGKTELNLA